MTEVKAKQREAEKMKQLLESLKELRAHRLESASKRGEGWLWTDHNVNVLMTNHSNDVVYSSNLWLDLLVTVLLVNRHWLKCPPVSVQWTVFQMLDVWW